MPPHKEDLRGQLRFETVEQVNCKVQKPWEIELGLTSRILKLDNTTIKLSVLVQSSERDCIFVLIPNAGK